MFWRKNDAISEYLKYLYHCEYLEKINFRNYQSIIIVKSQISTNFENIIYNYFYINNLD